MTFGIMRFELRYQLRNPVFWVAIGLFFLIGFGLTASENVSVGTPGGVHQNAPSAIATAIALFGLFYIFVITAFVANAIVRDDSSGFAPIIRATPVTPSQIVFGRFAGGLIIAWLGYLALPLGMAVGSLMPWVDPETIGPQRLAYYAWNYVVFGLPNLFLISALLFALATNLRSMFAAYIGAVILVMGYLVTVSIVGQKIEYRNTFARFEPMGVGALSLMQRYWTQVELNGRLVDLTGILAFNRLWTLLLGTVFLAITVWRFSMTERAPSARRLRRIARQKAKSDRAAEQLPALDGQRIVARNLAPRRLTQFMSRLRTEVRLVLTSPGTIVLVLLGVTQTAIALWLGRSNYGTADYPTLAGVVGTVRNGFAIVVLMIAGFYGGELVWRERERKLNELIDSTAVPSWVMTLPKILAIFIVLLLVNLAAMLTGLLYQLVEGSRDLNVIAYIDWYIVPAAIDGLLIAILAVVLQVLSPNKYVGWGILFVWFVGGIFLSNVGYSNPLYSYAGAPSVPLSDFNGRGSFWIGAVTFQIYWLLFAVVLIAFAHVLWPRGTDLGLRVRLRRLTQSTARVPLAIAAVAAVAMVGTGAYAYRNIKQLNRYETADQAEAYSAAYERKYLRNEHLPQPSITHVGMHVALDPAQRRMRVTGYYDLVNRTGKPLDYVHVRVGGRDTDVERMHIAGAHIVSNDAHFGYRIYRFDRPLPAGGTSRLDFQTQIWRRGFRAAEPATDVIENGTFVNNFEFAPLIGMSRQGLLSGRAKRRRQGLPPELRPAKLEDPSATGRNYISSDWVTSDITFSTSADQIPIAPGKRVSDVTANGRRTARFVSSAPILNFFSIQSSDYQVATKRHNGITLEVYYHRGHDKNVARMLNAMGSALDYYRSNFGPYQFDYARIIEFPGYQSFAQAFAGTMPYSETIGFNANTSDPNKIDFTSYVVAHEMAHQYWAHQETGADMQGATVTTETLAQYSALMVMKRMYGPDQIRRFLKYELDNYLSNRKGEVVEELPLERVEDQGYIHYRKGAVAMYLLQERLGEAAVDRALARFVAKYRFKGPPYPRSTNLIAEFRQEAKSPEDRAMIDDLFGRVTLYDLRVVDAKTKKVGAEWETSVTLAAAKAYANGKGAEQSAVLNEPIAIGLFTARPGLGAFSPRDVLLMRTQELHSGTQRLVLRSKTMPAFVGIDPYNTYIDRNSDDNVREVTL